MFLDIYICMSDHWLKQIVIHEVGGTHPISWSTKGNKNFGLQDQEGVLQQTAVRLELQQ
jgi:hypothetical protein